MSQILGELSPGILAQAFDFGSVQRGRAYAARGLVREVVVTTSDAGVLQLHGEVAGSGRTAYQTWVTVRGTPGSLQIHSTCTCPVAWQCKHAVALIEAARETDSTSTAPVWARRLGPLLDELERHEPAAQERPRRLALRFDLSMPRGRYGDTTPAIRIRPLQEGAKTNWIKTGASWRDLPNLPYGARHDRGQIEALAALANVATPGYYAYGAELRDLAGLTAGVWPALRRAREAGVAFVAGTGLDAITLLDDPATPTVDLEATADGLSIEVGAAADDRWWSGEQVVVLGHGHGLALLDQETGSAPPGGRSRCHLTLVQTDRLMPEALRRLLAQGRIEIPAHERADFEGEHLPRLRRQVAVVSSDGSVELPQERPPRLWAVVTWRDAGTVGVSWEWRYSVGASTAAFGLTSHDGLRGVRRPGAEAQILDALRLPEPARRLLGEGTGRPSPETELRDSDVLTFTDDVLPLLRDLEPVSVEERGLRPDYRLAEGDPEVRFDVASEATPEGERSTTDWLDLEIGVRVDGESVPVGSVLSTLTRGDEFVFLPSGLHVRADHPALRGLADLVAAAADITEQPREGVRVGRRDLSLWGQLDELGVVDAQADAWTRSARALRDLDTLPAVELTGIRSELRGYQQTGYEWLAFLWQSGLGGILADDMGLGKTLQTLALLCHARARGAGPFLVIAPTSVVSAWQHEAATHAPELRVVAVTAAGTRRGVPLADLVASADVLVTSYTLFRLEVEDYLDVPWGGLVLDEAHQLKNHQSKTYSCVRRLDVPFRLALTGTPFENRLLELWALLSIVAPGLYPEPKRFVEQVVKPVEKRGDADAMRRFRRRIKPFLLRRTKELVAADLPAKQEQVLEVTLAARHRRIYDTHLQRERQTVLGLVDDFERNRIAIFSSLTRLRQLSLDPALVDETYDAVGSAKLDILLEHVVELVAEGHRALVFSAFTGFLGRVRERLRRSGIETAYLDGKTRRRGEVIEQFRRGSAPVFLISLKAGGVGLTLTEADYVFVLDPWWNPAAEAQAVDRAHRIGQTRPVMVYRLVANDTIEEKVVALKERKAALFASVIDGDGLMASAIGADDVRALFEE